MKRNDYQPRPPGEEKEAWQQYYRRLTGPGVLMQACSNRWITVKEWSTSVDLGSSHWPDPVRPNGQPPPNICVPD
jgi:hypothetical protein